MEIRKTLYVTNRDEWRAWLTKHYQSETEVWLIYYKKHSGRPRIPYDDAVEEARVEPRHDLRISARVAVAPAGSIVERTRAGRGVMSDSSATGGGGRGREDRRNAERRVGFGDGIVRPMNSSVCRRLPIWGSR